MTLARTRSASAHQRVLNAAVELVAERGVDATSMDAIADCSGVSKATIYKHWPDKEALMLEMMAQMAGIHARPKFDSGNTRADMLAVLAYRPKEESETRERITPHLLGYTARNPAFGDAWRNMVMNPPRQELTRLIEKGIVDGELSKEIDLEIALALLLGPILYWYIFLRRSAGEPNGLAEEVVEVFWRAWGTS